MFIRCLIKFQKIKNNPTRKYNSKYYNREFFLIKFTVWNREFLINRINRINRKNFRNSEIVPIDTIDHIDP